MSLSIVILRTSERDTRRSSKEKHKTSLAQGTRMQARKSAPPFYYIRFGKFCSSLLHVSAKCYIISCKNQENLEVAVPFKTFDFKASEIRGKNFSKTMEDTVHTLAASDSWRCRWDFLAVQAGLNEKHGGYGRDPSY